MVGTSSASAIKGSTDPVTSSRAPALEKLSGSLTISHSKSATLAISPAASSPFSTGSSLLRRVPMRSRQLASKREP